MTESKLRNINLTVVQLEKLVKDVPTDLPDDHPLPDRTLKQLFHLGVYLRVLAAFLYDDGSMVAKAGLYVPYNHDGLSETDWTNWMDWNTDTTITPLLITINKFVRKLQLWYLHDYYGERTRPIEDRLTNFDALMHDAHDVVITRLRKAGMLPASAFNQNGVPLNQKDGCSCFEQTGTVTLVPDN